MLWTGTLALLSGVVLAPVYQPNAARAHASTRAISDHPLLGFARDLHHWSSALLIVLGLLYLLTGLFRSAYRRPGHWLWIYSLGVFLSGMLLQITGHLLPYDVQAVRTAVVESGIAENAPLVGRMQAELIRAGSVVGEPTLRRWFIVHVTLLTLSLLVFMILAFRASRKLRLPIFRISSIAGPTVVIVALALLAHSPLGAAAGPNDMASFDVRPEWYVLPLHSLLGLAQSWKLPPFLGTMVAPAVALAIVALLPWITPQGRPRIGKVLASVGAVSLAGLFLMSIGNVAPPVGEQISGNLPGHLAQPPKLDASKVALGRQLFQAQGCGDCHTVAGKGGRIGPDLTLEGDRRNDVSWHMEHLKEPRTVNPGSTMPSFRQLPSAELEALGQYMAALRQKA